VSDQIQQIVANTCDLISFPKAAGRVNAVVSSPDSGAADVAKAITQDPALAAKLLRIANSAFYGFRGEVSTVTRAVTLLGMNPIRSLVLGSASADLIKQLPNELVSLENFWPQAIQCSIAARELAGRCRGVEREALFIAGLLHNIGLLVLFNQMPEKSLQAQKAYIYGPEDRRREDAEAEVFGFNHAQVGAALLHAWDFPAALYEPIEFLTNPEQAPTYKKQAAVLQIAHTAAFVAETEAEDLDDAPEIDAVCFALTGLTEDDVLQVAEVAQSEMSSVRHILDLN